MGDLSAVQEEYLSLAEYYRCFTASLLFVFFSVPSFSESAVTLYRAVDSNLQWSERTYSLNDDYLKSNIWGLKGTEPINQQLDVFFNLEGKFSLSDGSSKDMFNKNSFVGLRHEPLGPRG